ncbi:MAG: PucC family protein [Acetobacteraceae bacterium]|nr:PucC family protein [Acetobacteraceae bacterium]
MNLARHWSKLGPAFLPFAEAATAELPMRRLLRLSLFQVTVGMAVVLLIGTLNRVMIVELGVPAWLVAVMVSLPLVFAPFRAVVGFRSDTHRSVLGWRRVPYLWFGTLLQFGGLAIMPFALIILSGDSNGPAWIGDAAAALAFLLVGAGLHTVQTVGLALATDLARPDTQPKVVALLCMMLLLGMVASALLFGALLADFSELRLIQVVQGAAVATMALNAVALWKQEARNPAQTAGGPRRSFVETWREFSRNGQARRRLVALGLGTVAFSMQDILLEPYGGHVLGFPVAVTTAMTALLAIGGMIGFCIGARLLGRGADPYRLAGTGALTGLAAFSSLIFAAPLEAPFLFALGVLGIGLGAGLFAHCTLTAAIGSAAPGQVGLVLGVWGAVQASAAGSAVALGGLIRDGVAHFADRGALGPTLATPATGYLAVYTIELALLFATLIAVGPLVRMVRPDLAYPTLSRS